MNDFTKEELEQLMSALHHANIDDWPVWKKIKSMIENYCDHDWENPCCGCPNSACICTKCGSKL